MVSKFFYKKCERFSVIEKPFKLIEYLKEKSNPNRILFLQETLSKIKDGTLWKYMHESYNSCDVLTVYLECNFCSLKEI